MQTRNKEQNQKVFFNCFSELITGFSFQRKKRERKKQREVCNSLSSSFDSYHTQTTRPLHDQRKPSRFTTMTTTTTRRQSSVSSPTPLLVEPHHGQKKNTTPTNSTKANHKNNKNKNNRATSTVELQVLNPHMARAKRVDIWLSDSKSSTATTLQEGQEAATDHHPAVEVIHRPPRSTTPMSHRTRLGGSPRSSTPSKNGKSGIVPTSYSNRRGLSRFWRGRSSSPQKRRTNQKTIPTTSSSSSVSFRDPVVAVSSSSSSSSDTRSWVATDSSAGSLSKDHGVVGDDDDDDFYDYYFTTTSLWNDAVLTTAELLGYSSRSTNTSPTNNQEEETKPMP